MAQSVEHVLGKDEVTSSSLVSSSKEKLPIFRQFFLISGFSKNVNNHSVCYAFATERAIFAPFFISFYQKQGRKEYVRFLLKLTVKNCHFRRR